jgi:DNA-directed RNA polymerase subunit RPC12/RpoP
MSRAERKNFLGEGNHAFECGRCGEQVRPLSSGFRNHCPRCLWSRHVDRVPGDRSERCGGMMAPIALEGAPGSGWILVHRCERCGALRRNKTAESDPEQPDSWEAILDVSTRPR